jgi:ABC-type transport system involved in multi-copper enzyme maturation permease subunit
VRLIRIELRRALARRLTKIVFLVAILGIVAAGLTVFFKSQKTYSGPSPEDIKAQQISFCVQAPDTDVEKFAFGPAANPGEPSSPERITFCTKALANANFASAGDRRFKLIDIKEVYKGLSLWLAIIGWLLAASYIGAEWRTGNMTTLLTWEPRRMRVMLAKLFATLIVVFCLVVLLQALLVGALFPAALYRGTTAGTTMEFWRTFSYQGLRIAGLATVAAALGFAVGSLGRNTAAGLGAGFIYIAVVEGGLLGGLIPKVRPWLILGNAIVFINNQTSSDIAGRTPTQAGLLLLGYGAALVLIAALFFKRRDVT